MHNVKKTPAGEAYAVSEDRKRKEKLKMFITLRDRIFSKRDNGEFDEEVLAMTSELLKKNPDIYSFWGIRRKALAALSNKKDGESDEALAERVKALYDEELSLTKDALFASPKSYGAWYHRFLTFQNHPCADLQKELELCEKALSVDSRNFHCWDHRRSVAKLAKLTDEEELKFSDKLIAQNPSNYSAWHYRGTILPRIQPDLDENAPYKMPISEECLNAEFEKAEQVCSLNSEDQTAWTYSRWLCEAACAWDNETSQIIETKYAGSGCFDVKFNKAVNREFVKSVVTSPNSALSFEAVSAFKCPESAKKYQSTKAWKVFALSLESLSLSVNDESVEVSADKSYHNDAYFAKAKNYGKCLREGPRNGLTKLIEVCEELIKIDKGDIPWEVIALARAKLHLYGTTLENVKELGKLYERIKELDPQRRNMYCEILQKIEQKSITEAASQF